jgi:CRP/FNR family transcriptional regulator, cyclic AMP receptor protein
MGNVHILQQTDIFFEFDPDQLAQVAALCGEKRAGVGDWIFEENSASDELYVIAQGEIEILVDPSLVGDRTGSPSRPTTIATLRRGQSFGEVALVDQGVRSAGARSASHDTHLLVIPRQRLMDLCSHDPTLGFRLMRNLAADLATKMRNTDLRIREELLLAQRGTRPPTES